MSELDTEQVLQEAQYEFPYHYIPRLEDGQFSQVRYWSWGYRYLGGFKVVLDQLAGESFESLVDVGCGDGRFLATLKGRYDDARLVGIDYSERAVRLARALNPEVDFRRLDLTGDPVDEQFDMVTLIEVLEHIPPDDLEAFVAGFAGLVRPGGRLVLTVPHRNVTPQAKHYQHFDSEQLAGLLAPHFEELEFIPFDPGSKVLAVLKRLLGGRGEHFLITDRRLTSFFFSLYVRRYLYVDEERRCRRIAVVGERKREE